MNFPRIAVIASLTILLAPFVFAQGTQVAFGDLQHDTSLPVEVSADQLNIDQADGTATFRGSVIIGQGEMRLTAGIVRVEYSTVDGQATGDISRLFATGGVTLVNGAAAAEAQEAEYSIDTGTIIMTGNVILAQGENALSSERMVIDLSTGSASMEGRVRTILQTGGN